MKKRIVLYIFLLILGYFTGRAVERLSSLTPAEPIKPITLPKPQTASQPSGRFSTVTELKLHDYDKAIEQKKKLFLVQRENHDDTSAVLKELAELTEASSTLAKKEGSSFEISQHLQHRCWYYLASDDIDGAEEVMKLALQTEPSRSGYLRIWVARHYREFGHFLACEEYYRTAISEERDVARQYEHRLELSRMLIEAKSYSEASTELDTLQIELEQATQKAQIVGYLNELWREKQALAEAQGDDEVAVKCGEVAHQYFEYRQRLRK